MEEGATVLDYNVMNEREKMGVKVIFGRMLSSRNIWFTHSDPPSGFRSAVHHMHSCMGSYRGEKKREKKHSITSLSALISPFCSFYRRRLTNPPPRRALNLPGCSFISFGWKKNSPSKVTPHLLYFTLFPFHLSFSSPCCACCYIFFAQIYPHSGVCYIFNVKKKYKFSLIQVLTCFVNNDWTPKVY